MGGSKDGWWLGLRPFYHFINQIYVDPKSVQCQIYEYLFAYFLIEKFFYLNLRLLLDNSNLTLNLRIPLTSGINHFFLNSKIHSITAVLSKLSPLELGPLTRFLIELKYSLLYFFQFFPSREFPTIWWRLDTNKRAFLLQRHRKLWSFTTP